MTKIAKTKSKSSKRWLNEHFSDEYVKRAQKEGYRSRAVYKLIEIDNRDKLFKPGMIVVDLGAAPGSWSEWLIKKIKPKGRIIAVDLLPIDSIPDVEFIQGDFTDEAILSAMHEKLHGEKVDWVLSDMAPNMSGNESIDIPKAMYLAELALDFVKENLKPNGGMLIKVFQGDGSDALLQAVKSMFQSVVIRKPKASRGRSREIYLLARALKSKE